MIYALSYKSLFKGTHWIYEIIFLILNDGKIDSERCFQGLEITPVNDPTKLQSSSPGYKVFEAFKSPRCIPSHCREEFRPPQILTKNAKVMVLGRGNFHCYGAFYSSSCMYIFLEIAYEIDEFLFCINANMAIGFKGQVKKTPQW